MIQKLRKKEKMMEKRKKSLIIIGILVAIVLVFALLKMKEDKIVRIGEVKDDFPILSNGEYQLQDVSLQSGEYIVYALEGKGIVSVDGKDYSLDDADYQEAKKQPNITKKAVLYELGENVELSNGSQITVDGTDNFKISFLKR